MKRPVEIAAAAATLSLTAWSAVMPALVGRGYTERQVRRLVERGELTAFGLAQFDPITYIHPDLLVGGPDESTNESKIRRRPQPQRSNLHRKARPVPGLHLHLLAHVPTPARRGRHATPLSSQPAFSPPDDRDA